MVEVISATILLVSMYLSMEGFLFATYVLLALSFLQISIMTIGTVTIFSIDSEQFKDIKEKTNSSSRKIGLRILIQFFYMAACFHLFQIGYVFISGILAFSLAITFLTSIIDLIKSNY